MSYLILFFPIKWIFKSHKIKVIRIYSAFIFSILIVAYLIFYSPVKNNEIAEIKSAQSGYELTLTGKRLNNSHNLISVFSKKTYLDTLKILLPRKKGTINGGEIKVKKGNYKYLGTIDIENKKINLDLYYNNYDNNTKEPLIWNDKYELRRQL